MPSHLTSKAQLLPCGGALAGLASMGTRPSGIGSASGSTGGGLRGVRPFFGGWAGGVHPVDEPFLGVLPGADERVAAVQALAVEGGDDLVIAPLLRGVGAAVPDRHRPGAVLALGDLAVEVEVLERV